MRLCALALTAATTLIASRAHADFVIVGQPPDAVSGPAGLATAPNSAPEATTEPPAVHTRRASPASKPTQGFGNQVPLSFAVRQIVPKTVKVSYSAGVDADALVDWKGGDPWNRTLQAAVKPLGLKLVATDTAVQIKK